MKYTIETIIEKPLDQVTQLYNDPLNYIKWMPGIISHQITSGKNREAGSTSIFTFKMNGRDFILEETVLKNDLSEIMAQYRSNGTVNTQITQFSAIDVHNTRYTVIESFQLKGWMKVIGFLMPEAFKKQTRRFVQAFKNFSEH